MLRVTNRGELFTRTRDMLTYIRTRFYSLLEAVSLLGPGFAYSKSNPPSKLTSSHLRPIIPIYPSSPLSVLHRPRRSIHLLPLRDHLRSRDPAKAVKTRRGRK